LLLDELCNPVGADVAGQVVSITLSHHCLQEGNCVSLQATAHNITSHHSTTQHSSVSNGFNATSIQSTVAALHAAVWKHTRQALWLHTSPSEPWVMSLAVKEA
jgi:hypothetical protein